MAANELPHAYRCSHCLRKHTFTRIDEVWFCPCGCVYRREERCTRVWDVNGHESKRPEWAKLGQQTLGLSA